MHQDMHSTKNSQGKWNKIVNSGHNKTRDQIVMIDLADETRIPRYLTLWLCDHFYLALLYHYILNIPITI
jgi:hypothetical protein